MYFGIDLGTSNSAIAGLNDGRVRIFKTPEGTDTMPSVIHRDRRGNQTVGVRAYDQAFLAPDNTVQGFKRLMGTDTPFRFSSTTETITAEQASTEVLRSLLGQALIESGAASVNGAVVTIPAAFDQIQSEATLAAARASGIKNVALLQEPVAAALAAMAGAVERSGLFLVYDLGGGTFDAALIHALDGEVTVLAHNGINMLGGRDLDRSVMENVALPWLRRTFDLPSNFPTDTKFARLVRMARRAAEGAKIALSSKEETTINASDEEVRLEDNRGEPIYLDAPLSRSVLERLAEDMAQRSVGCCRDMLAEVGYRHEDVARIVLIGGPTKMPFLRRRIENSLGIQVEDIARVDPMTAVAAGAAIYCEGRDWSASGSHAKAGRRTETTDETAEISYDYEARTASDAAKLTIRQIHGSSGAQVLVESFLGWSSGRRLLAGAATVELPLKDTGPNRFRVTVFAANGVPIAEASREIIVERLLAMTGGVPATHTIATKILDDKERNVLHAIVRKGTILPANGVVSYRLSGPIRSGGGGSLRIELFQINDERVSEPHLNRKVGEFQISADDLPEATALRKGEIIIIHWFMSESHEITAEIEIPKTQQRFDNRKFYNWQIVKLDFSGEEGAKLVDEHVSRALLEMESAEEAVQPVGAAPLARLRERLETQTNNVRGSLDAEVRKSLIEEVLLIRQEIAMTCLQPDARRQLLRRRLAEQKNFYDRDVRDGASRDQLTQVAALLSSTENTIEQGGKDGLDMACDLIDQVRNCYWTHGFAQEAFCAKHYLISRQRRHLAGNPLDFDGAVAMGNAALEVGDLKSVRNALLSIIMDQVSIGGDAIGPERAALMLA